MPKSRGFAQVNRNVLLSQRASETLAVKAAGRVAISQCDEPSRRTMGGTIVEEGEPDQYSSEFV